MVNKLDAHLSDIQEKSVMLLFQISGGNATRQSFFELHKSTSSGQEWYQLFFTCSKPIQPQSNHIIHASLSRSDPNAKAEPSSNENRKPEHSHNPTSWVPIVCNGATGSRSEIPSSLLLLNAWLAFWPSLESSAGNLGALSPLHQWCCFCYGTMFLCSQSRCQSYVWIFVHC